MPRFSHIVFVVLISLILFLRRSSERMLRLPPLNCTPTDLSGRMPSGFEPSDAAYLPERNSWIVVSDDSRFLLVPETLDQEKSLEVFKVGNGTSYDLEGAAWTPFGPILGSERPPALLLYTPELILKQVVPLAKPSTKNKGVEALLYIPSGPKDGYLLAGIQEDAKILIFHLPDMASAGILEKQPGPGNDLSALTLRERDGLVYAVYDKHRTIAAFDLRKAMRIAGLLPVPLSFEAKAHDLSKQQIWTRRYATPARGVEALSFGAGKVLVGIDAPKKQGGKKALWVYDEMMWERCFADRTAEEVDAQIEESR